MVPLRTCITGDETFKFHLAKNVEEKVIAQLIVRQFINIKMKRSDNIVHSFVTITSTVIIKDKVAVIETNGTLPTQAFR